MKKLSNLQMEQLNGGIDGTSCYFLGIALAAAPFFTAIAYHNEIRACWNS